MARRTQAERSDETTSRLIAAARSRFGRSGYRATAIEAIAEAAGVTKGAAYHHFGGKADLFRAVFVGEQERLVAELEGVAAAAPDAWAALRGGCRTFLEHCLDREFRQIVLLDGPAVLGWDGVRAIESTHVLRVLDGGIRVAAAAGLMVQENLEARSRMIFGALCEGGMVLARAEDPDSMLSAVVTEADRLLNAARVTR